MEIEKTMLGGLQKILLEQEKRANVCIWKKSESFYPRPIVSLHFAGLERIGPTIVKNRRTPEEL